MADATRRGEQARFALATAQERHRAATEDVEAALEALHDSDARMAAVAERLGHLGATVRGARAEAERTERAVADATAALEVDREELAALAERLEEAGAEPADAEEPSTDERDRLELEASRGAHRRDRAAPHAAHQGGAGPRPARPRRLPRGRGPQRAGRP